MPDARQSPAPRGSKLRLIRLTGLVTRGREVRDTPRHCVINGVSHDAVLEHRLVEIRYVVDDDLGSIVGERGDPRGEILFRRKCRVEGDRGAGCNVVHDLTHRPTFIRALRIRHGVKVLKDADSEGQVAVHGVLTRAGEVLSGGKGTGCAVEAVREDADRDAAAVDVELRASQVAAHRLVALRGRESCTGRGHRRLREAQPRCRGHVAERAHRNAPGHPMVVGLPVLQSFGNQLAQQALGIIAVGADADVTALGPQGWELAPQRPFAHRRLAQAGLAEADERGPQTGVGAGLGLG